MTTQQFRRRMLQHALNAANGAVSLRRTLMAMGWFFIGLALFNIYYVAVRPQFSVRLVNPLAALFELSLAWRTQREARKRWSVLMLLRQWTLDCATAAEEGRDPPDMPDSINEMLPPHLRE